MASEFQRQKINVVFDAMDADDDGFLTEPDFRALTGRWLAIRDDDADAPRSRTLSSIMMGWWTTLRAAADQDRDDRVTLDEVLFVVDLLVDMTDAVTRTADAMFDAVDENGDGRVSALEYRRMIEAWRGKATDTDEVFPLLDLDGDGRLSREEFRDLWADFWTGDDPSAPGTWVFGRFDRTVPA